MSGIENNVQDINKVLYETMNSLRHVFEVEREFLMNGKQKIFHRSSVDYPMITDKTIQTAISGAWLQTYLSLSNTPTNDSHVVVLYHGYS